MSPLFFNLIAALIGGLLPTIVWLMFWLSEDDEHPEPASLILRAFTAGGLAVVAVWAITKGFVSIWPLISPYVVAIFSFWGLSIQNFFVPPSVLRADPTIANPIAIFGTFILLAAVEEIIKWGAVSFAVLHNKNFDEPIDAMIYMITGALGFAAIENILFLFGIFSSDLPIELFALTGPLRFLGATVLHAVASGLIGGMIAYSFCKPEGRRVRSVIIGLVLAILLHALFNYFILMSESTSLVLLFLWFSAIFLIYWFERVRYITCALKPHSYGHW